MRFHPPPSQGKLLRRYKRFLADVDLDGTTVTAHCTNTGRMTGCSDPGSTVLLSPASNPARKLAWTLRLIKVGRCWVSVDTSIPNTVVAEALRRRRVPELADYDEVATEVPYGQDRRSRIDVLLTDSTGRLPPAYVEVKNVTLRDGPVAIFPDAVSERGKKHLEELAREVRQGNRAVLVPFVARADCTSFDAAWEVDPEWAATLEVAADAGVEVLPYRARIDRRGVSLGAALPWIRRPHG